MTRVAALVQSAIPLGALPRDYSRIPAKAMNTTEEIE